MTTPNYSSIIDRALRMKREKQALQTVLAWAVLNLSLAGIIYTEMLGEWLSQYYWPIWYIQLALTSLFIINALFDFWKYLKYTMDLSTTEEHSLFGLTNTNTQAALSEIPVKKESLPSSPLQGQNGLSDSPSYPDVICYHRCGYRRLPRRDLSTSASFENTLDLISNSSSLIQNKLGSTEGSHQRACYSTAPYTFNYFGSKDMEYLKRLERQSYPRQPGSLESVFWDNSLTFWNYIPSVRTYGLRLWDFLYQPVCRPQAPTKLDSNQPVNELWARIAPKRPVTDHIDCWTMKLRTWIIGIILVPLVKEIDRVNSQLRGMGYPKLQIGETSISYLTQLATMNQSALPTLLSIIPYLDITLNQKYIVNRIRELGHGSYMSSFHWNSGSHPNGKWDISLPTDCAIIMNVFCTYLDSRLPFDPQYPDRRTFTSQHFSLTPQQPDVTKENLFCIHQSSTNPPHYQLIYEGRIYNLPEGRNNLFHTIIMFLCVIETNMLGQLNKLKLGPFGVNLSWIFKD